MFGPRAWPAMATWAAGALATHSVNRNGEAVSGPSARMPRRSFSVNDAGPNAVAITTSVSPASPLPPASAMAMRAAATASLEGGSCGEPWPGGPHAVRSAAPDQRGPARALGQVVPGRAVHLGESGARRARSASARAAAPQPKLADDAYPGDGGEGHVSPSARGRERRSSRRRPGSSRRRPARRDGLRSVEDEAGADGGVHASAAGVAWTSRSRRPSTVAMASMAPDEPRRWPTTPLVEVSGTSDARGAEGGLEGGELGDVVEGRARAVRVDEVDLVRIQAGVGERAREGERGPAPSGCGAVMWLASQEAPEPRSSARGVAPRARAWSTDSKMSTPAPSPIDMPARPSRNGRQGASSTRAAR